MSGRNLFTFEAQATATPAEAPAVQRYTREQWTAKKQATQEQALARAEQGTSVMNYGPILEGFAARGIPLDEIKPRENVFTFNAWKAKGRFVRKGEHGVKVVTWVNSTRREPDSGEERAVRYCTNTTVFHISQTDEVTR